MGAIKHYIQTNQIKIIPVNGGETICTDGLRSCTSLMLVGKRAQMLLHLSPTDEVDGLYEKIKNSLIFADIKERLNLKIKIWLGNEGSAFGVMKLLCKLNLFKQILNPVESIIVLTKDYGDQVKLIQNTTLIDEGDKSKIIDNISTVKIISLIASRMDANNQFSDELTAAEFLNIWSYVVSLTKEQKNLLPKLTNGLAEFVVGPEQIISTAELLQPRSLVAESLDKFMATATSQSQCSNYVSEDELKDAWSSQNTSNLSFKK